MPTLKIYDREPCGRWKVSGIVLSLLACTSLLGCIVAIPVAVAYYRGTQNYVAAAEVNVAPDKAFQAAVKEVEARGDQLKILERDDSKRLLKITDGKQTAELKIAALDASKIKLIVTADIEGGEQEKEKELALRIIDVWCKAMGLEYKVIEG
ncbi:MAG: hypothetical protein JSW39_28245 [Desulfobacterales bacterium]|nr:MAG: hypothetical protein JSW39_28245 [Desulfobacterales bacterium]